MAVHRQKDVSATVMTRAVLLFTFSGNVKRESPLPVLDGTPYQGPQRHRFGVLSRPDESCAELHRVVVAQVFPNERSEHHPAVEQRGGKLPSISVWIHQVEIGNQGVLVFFQIRK